jgi:hypothetical protein
VTAARSALAEIVAEAGCIPLAWAGSTTKMNYLNFGDALSPVMVALCTGLGVERVPFRSSAPRLAAVGTIAHGMEGGTVWFWGTGCSSYSNPSAPPDERIAYRPPTGTDIRVTATRGPVAANLLTGGKERPNPVYGDPVWLLPRFYPAKVEKRWDLGVILHLSELADRELEAHPHAKYLRYGVSDREKASIRLINTVTPIGAGGLRDKLDEILACRRIVSTSLHGMVIAESYGIPCLYFPPNGPAAGLCRVAPTIDSSLDLRIVDLYQGLGVGRLPIYVQDRLLPTDWGALIEAIDRTWQPVDIDGDALIEALPVPPAPIAAPPGATIFEHDLILGLKFQHDVTELNRADKLRARMTPHTVIPPDPPRFIAVRAPVIRRSPEAPPGLREVVAQLGGIPLSWAAPTRTHPYPNLGDALSAVMVGTIAGLPVIRRDFDDPRQRLVAVGTIGHGQKNGQVHFWGTGLDGTHFQGVPPGTEFLVHAMRGPQSAGLLRASGVAVPEIYGDPVWFLPKILPRRRQPAKFELGVIVHISELEEQTVDARVKEGFRRYQIPEALAGSIRIINTFAPRTIEGLLRKVDEFLDCKRIASTSFHGLLIGDTYGIPSVWFGTQGNGPGRADARDPASGLDHRIQDFYAACRVSERAIFRTQRDAETDWDALVRWIDEAWTPPEYDGTALFEAFPLPPAVALSDTVWPAGYRVVASLVP